MKLSDIITHFVDHPDHLKKPVKQYILFSKYRRPYITLVDNLNDLNSESFAYVAKNPEVINLEYLYYYIRLHMGLLRGPGFKEGNQYGLDHMNLEFINNVELPSLPSVEIQNVLVPFIRKLYKIELIDSNIDELFCVGYNYLDSAPEEGAYELFKIRDRELFFKNIKKGKFIDPINDYIEILKPELLNEKYLVYYLYYKEALEDSSNYYRNYFNFENFHTDYLHICLPSMSRQKLIIETMDIIHNKIRKLMAKRRANKLALRKLIDEV